MGKRLNRKRTRDRPRYRKTGRAPAPHGRPFTQAMSGTQPIRESLADPPHWHQTHHIQDNRSCENQHEQARDQQLRIFGGYPDDEESFFEPMLKIVTDLFDGNTDYEDP
ncbi:hypothetical protein IQ07DRAFT_686227 [Pyrenochaeta sp. DS3sAY3a]|nr:hypothetical protein IQ07DRAFT_686227 [Pyrenochaeta sp. DS3sAY3a]